MTKHTTPESQNRSPKCTSKIIFGTDSYAAGNANPARIRCTAQLNRQSRLVMIGIGIILLIPLLACGSSDLLGSIAPSDSTDGTVVVMQATIDALQTQQAQPTPQPEVQIIYFTSTPLPATATPLPPPPTVTPVPPTTIPPTATATPIPAPQEVTTQSRTIVIIVTPTSPPTPTPYPEAPIIISPEEGTVVAKDREILMHWGWNGLLEEPDEYYEVKIRPDGSSRSVYIAQERGLSHNFVARLGGGRYYWTVQIVKGHWINNSGHPDDWVFEGFRSPESEPRLIVVADNHNNHRDRNRSPHSQSHAVPPGQNLPYGIAFGGIAFAAFVGLTRFKH